MSQVITGSEMLGRGVSLFGKPEAFLDVLCDTSSPDIAFKSGGKDYHRAKSVGFQETTFREEGLEVFLNREEYQRSAALKVDAKGAYGAFSGSFELSFGTEFSAFSERTAAMQTYSSHLWTLRLDDKTPSARLLQSAEYRRVPAVFNRQNAAAFYEFFDRFGTHVVREVVLGGSLEYAMMIDRTQTSDKKTIEAKVRAEYGAFFSGSASASQVDEVKKFSQHRRSTLRLRGGDTSAIQLLNPDAPRDMSAEFRAWVDSIPNKPWLVSKKLSRIDDFLDWGDRKAAVTTALDLYLSGRARLESTWKDSTIVLVGEETRLAAGAAGAAKPALHLVMANNKSLQREEHYFEAPAGGAPETDFAKYWGDLAQFLQDANLKEKVLLLATERWPRDARYLPPPKVRQHLLAHGVRHAGLARWESLTKDLQACPIAGLSWVSASAGTGLDSGKDALSVGFAKPGGTPECVAGLSVFLVHRADGRVEIVLDEAHASSNSALYTLQCTGEMQYFMAADPGDSSRMKGVTYDAHDLGLYWYMYQVDRPRSKPYLFINYKTCGCAEGNGGQGESRLTGINYGNIQDEALWDFRGGDGDCHMLMLPTDNLNQCLVGDRIAVRPWNQAGLHWRRVARQL